MPPVSFVKTIGDAVMSVSTDTVQLITAVLELIDVAAANDLPQLRAGVATGSPSAGAGDWFGSPVNIASRVTGLAHAGTVVVTASARKTVGAAGDSCGRRRGRTICAACPRVCGFTACHARSIRHMRTRSYNSQHQRGDD
jgi:class 3 adenylate cyclase